MSTNFQSNWEEIQREHGNPAVARTMRSGEPCGVVRILFHGPIWSMRWGKLAMSDDNTSHVVLVWDEGMNWDQPYADIVDDIYSEDESPELVEELLTDRITLLGHTYQLRWYQGEERKRLIRDVFKEDVLLSKVRNPPPRFFEWKAAEH